MPQAETVAIPKRLPLVITPQNRDTSSLKDSKLVNVYVEKSDAGDFWLFKRPGLARDSQPAAAAAARTPAAIPAVGTCFFFFAATFFVAIPRVYILLD